MLTLMVSPAGTEPTRTRRENKAVLRMVRGLRWEQKVHLTSSHILRRQACLLLFVHKHLTNWPLWSQTDAGVLNQRVPASPLCSGVPVVEFPVHLQSWNIAEVLCDLEKLTWEDWLCSEGALERPRFPPPPAPPPNPRWKDVPQTSQMK